MFQDEFIEAWRESKLQELCMSLCSCCSIRIKGLSSSKARFYSFTIFTCQTISKFFQYNQKEWNHNLTKLWSSKKVTSSLLQWWQSKILHSICSLIIIVIIIAIINSNRVESKADKRVDSRWCGWMDVHTPSCERVSFVCMCVFILCLTTQVTKKKLWVITLEEQHCWPWPQKRTGKNLGSPFLEIWEFFQLKLQTCYPNKNKLWLSFSVWMICWCSAIMGLLELF